MAKRAGELFIKEKVRSAYRRWLDKRIAPYIAPLGKKYIAPVAGASFFASLGASDVSLVGASSVGKYIASGGASNVASLGASCVASVGTAQSRRPQRSARSVSVVGMEGPCLPAALSGVARVDLWTDRNSTPIFPLPIIRHPAKYGRKKIARKRVCALIRTPTPPDFHLPELFPGISLFRFGLGLKCLKKKKNQLKRVFLKGRT